MKLVLLATVAAPLWRRQVAVEGMGDRRSHSQVFGLELGLGDTAISAAPVQQGGVVTGSGITVVGTGTRRRRPDVADWSFGVSSQAATASDALSANASR
jgi:uncharacterized protein YggE